MDDQGVAVPVAAGSGGAGRPRIYLAGPEVFRPDAREVFRRKCELCEKHGLEGVSPLDSEPEVDARDVAYRISRANEALMRSCHGLIANLTPFRGISADVGTAFELGYMRALGRPVIGYTTEASELRARTEARLPGTRRGPEGVVLDPDGRFVEDFGLRDNLMLEGAINASGFALVVVEPRTELEGFETCARRIAAALADTLQGGPA